MWIVMDKEASFGALTPSHTLFYCALIIQKGKMIGSWEIGRI